MLSKSEIKYIQSLSQKKFRDIENIYLIEGPKIVEEALNTPGVPVKKLYALPSWIQEHRRLLPPSVVTEVSEIELQRISMLKTPNQVVALVEKPWKNIFRVDLHNWVLALDCIQDPGNFGTIIRIADWFGVTQIICSEDCADQYNAKVIQAAMGSTFRVELQYTKLAEFLAALETIPIYAAGLQGVPLRSAGELEKGILVIGNESKGISAAVSKLAGRMITIEKYGNAESLNAAVATGIILSHLIS